MKTSLECLPCFRRQARYAASLATTDPSLQARLVAEADDYLAGLDLDESPPVNAIGLYRLVSALSCNPDPFAALKRQSNDLALGRHDQVAAMIRQADDPIFRAILFAIAGNIIDYGAQQDFDLDKTLGRCLQNQPMIDDYEELRGALAQARTVLYLADNCGEIVFDGLLVEQLPGTVTMVVKEGPIINDATLADAEYCGLVRKCRIITNGVVCPGLPLARCGQEVRTLFAEADVVISKGQGNFETLSEVRRPVFHLLTVKCPVVGRHAAEVRGCLAPIPLGAALIMRLGG